MEKQHTPFNSGLADGLAAVKITHDSIAWFEFEHGRKYAPWPKNKLRLAARKAGFRSSAQFLAAERRTHA